MNATATTVESPSIFRQELEHVKADMQRLRRDLSELWGDSVHTARSGAAEAPLRQGRHHQGGQAGAEHQGQRGPAGADHGGGHRR